MSKFAGHRGLWAALAVALAIASQATLASAQEPRNKCELRLELRGPDVPLLTEIPFVGRFFQDAAAQQCQGEACQLERIGVDFNSDGGVMQPVDAARLWHGDCQVCPLPGKHAVFEWLPAKQCQVGTCGTDQCASSCDEGKCCAGKCCPAAEIHVVSAAACCGGKCASGDCASKCCAAGDCANCPCKSDKTAHHHVDVIAENAALKATIAGKEALLAAKSEMFESLARLMVENAKLEAKLEMVEHRDAMLKEMVELQAQNTELKLAAELAEEQQGQLEEQLEMVLENERLKLRIAELEKQHQGEPVLTAKRPKKVR